MIKRKSLEQKLKVGMLRVKTDSHGCSIDCQLDRIITEINKHKPDMLLAPEWYFHKGTPYTIKEKETILKYIKEEASNRLILPGTFIWTDGKKLYNSTPIIMDGELKDEYHKHTDGGTFSIASSSGLELGLGKEEGKAFKWRGLEIGLEICADHYSSCLKESGRNKLDLHVVLACGIGIHNRFSAVRRGGYILCCDGSTPKNEAKKRVMCTHININCRQAGYIDLLELIYFPQD